MAMWRLMHGEVALMAPPRRLAVLGAVSSVAFATLLLMSLIFTQSPDATQLLSSGAPAAGDQHDFFATLAPGGSLHKLSAATGNGALATAEKKLSSYAYPKFPSFARSPKAGPRVPKMSLTDIEKTLQTDAADLLKDSGPAHAAIAINTPRLQSAPPLAAPPPPAAALASPSTFAAGGVVGSPFPAKGARVIYIGGGDAPVMPRALMRQQQPSSYARQRTQQQQQQQPSYSQHAAQAQQQNPSYRQQRTVYVGGSSAPQSNRLFDQRAAAAYASRLPMSRDAMSRDALYSQGLDVNNPYVAQCFTRAPST